MTKFARLRVDVPVDDGMPVTQVRDHLRALLEERNTEALDLADGAQADAEADPLIPTPPRARVHWPAVTVVLAIERPPAPVETRRKRRGNGEGAT